MTADYKDVEDRNAVLQFLNYDPATGFFTHIRPIAKGWFTPPGTRAGTKTKKGYIRICVNGRQVFAHRLAWLIAYGSPPKGYIDHINGDRSDNRIANLRVVNKAMNAQNRQGANSNNSHGFLGVTYRPRQGWLAQIGIDGKQKVLGYFGTPEEASATYMAARRALHAGNTL